jgi:Holliday junction resolvase
MTNSIRKGKAFERTIAKFLRNLGVKDARRGQQFCGSADSPDVVGLNDLHIEAKRVEKLNIDNAMTQAVIDCGSNVPSVWHQKNRGVMMITIRADDVLRFAKLIVDQIPEVGNDGGCGEPLRGG